jgi:type II secretory pathway component GspD/PulD (secretin)
MSIYVLLRRGGAVAALAAVCGSVSFGLLGGCVEVDTTKIPDEEKIISPEVARRLEPLATRPSTRPVPVPEPVFIEAGEKSTLIYSCRNTKPDVLSAAIEGLVSPEGNVQASAALNVVVVSDRPELVRSISKVLAEMDRRVPQLLVEARVVEVTVNDDLETEIRQALRVPAGNSFFQSSNVTLTTPGASPTVGEGSNINLRPFVSGGYEFDSFVRLLMTRGKAKILSSPNLLVSAGSEASIITGQEVPVQSATVVGSSSSITTQFKRVGIKLRVNLLQITNDTARIELNPEVSTVTGYVNTGTAGDTTQVISNPIIAIRNVSSTLALKDGEILTVGGLLSTSDTETVKGVPLLMDIPGLGQLFRSTRKQRARTQLIFFLRVHVLAEGTPDGIRVHSPDDSMKVLDSLPRAAGIPTTNPATLEPKPGDRPLDKKE